MCALCRHRSRYMYIRTEARLCVVAVCVSFPHIVESLSLTLAYRSILDDSSSRARLVDTQHQPVDGKNSIYNVLNFALLFFPTPRHTRARLCYRARKLNFLRCGVYGRRRRGRRVEASRGEREGRKMENNRYYHHDTIVCWRSERFREVEECFSPQSSVDFP